jgi:hypothetical protein
VDAVSVRISVLVQPDIVQSVVLILGLLQNTNQRISVALFGESPQLFDEFCIWLSDAHIAKSMEFPDRVIHERESEPLPFDKHHEKEKQNNGPLFDDHS